MRCVDMLGNYGESGSSSRYGGGASGGQGVSYKQLLQQC